MLVYERVVVVQCVVMWNCWQKGESEVCCRKECVKDGRGWCMLGRKRKMKCVGGKGRVCALR